ncbi:hypothetical protein PF007_g25586 [Phytophthora fragariae]|uniref:PiggyBac transposable element-derived protein domain-containing protein n=1 Tax=Phytophthora fragariae TaxID=53985 RepID=A0A6A3QD86_9STRA|nr:hypothetical protein PF007_g25586 [Phytophthora fragariae]
MAFTIAQICMQPSESSSEAVSVSEDDEYQDSYEEDDDDDDRGLPLQLAQEEASAELDDLSDADSVTKTQPHTTQDDTISDEGRHDGGLFDEDTAIATLESSRGRVVEEDGAFMKGFDQVHDSWEDFFSALKKHCDETWQLLPKRTSYTADLRNKKMKERGVPDGDPRLLPSTFPYYSLTLLCTHGIDHPKKGKGKRQRRIIRYLACGAKVNASSRRSHDGEWKVGSRCGRGPEDKKNIIAALQLVMKAESATAYSAYRQEMLRSLGNDKKDAFFEYFKISLECKGVANKIEIWHDDFSAGQDIPANVGNRKGKKTQRKLQLPREEGSDGGGAHNDSNDK